jgi:hypothetical protein
MEVIPATNKENPLEIPFHELVKIIDDEKKAESKKFRLKDVYNELINAISEDKADKKKCIDAGLPNTSPSVHKIIWFKKYFWIVAVFAFIGIALFNVKKEKKRSHHGVNKYGRRY